MLKGIWSKVKSLGKRHDSFDTDSLPASPIRRPMALNRKSSILCQLYEKKHFTSKEFRRLWDFYDKDGSGFLEYSELERFLRDLTEVTLGEDVDEAEYEKFKAKIMGLIDDNQNGKLEAKELSKIIPTEENFLLAYSIQSQNLGAQLSSQDFLEIWCHYDKDCSGYLDFTEAKDFMKDMLKVNSVKVDLNNVTYLDTFFKTFDTDDNGVIEIDEMAAIFPVEERFTNALKQRKRFTKEEFDRLFDTYDTNKSGMVTAKQLPKMISDLSKISKSNLSEKQVAEISGRLIQMFANKDIPRTELSLVISSNTPQHGVQFKREMNEKRQSLLS